MGSIGWGIMAMEVVCGHAGLAARGVACGGDQARWQKREEPPASHGLATYSMEATIENGAHPTKC